MDGGAWDGNSHPWPRGCQLFANPGNFLLLPFIFVAKEGSPDIMAEHNLGLCDMIKCCFFYGIG